MTPHPLQAIVSGITIEHAKAQEEARLYSGVSSEAMRCAPWDTSADRLRFKGVVASRHVLNLLWEKHISHRADLMRLLYDQFQANSCSRSWPPGGGEPPL